MLQDGVQEGLLDALCFPTFIQGKSCRMGNIFLPLDETSRVSWTWRLCQQAGEFYVRDMRGTSSDQAWGPCRKAKSFFRGKGSRRIVPSAAPDPACAPHCTLQLPARHHHRMGVQATAQLVRRAMFRYALLFLV